MATSRPDATTFGIENEFVKMDADLLHATARKLGDNFVTELSPHMAEWVSPTMDGSQSILEIRSQALAYRQSVLSAALAKDIWPLAASVSITGDRMSISKGERYEYFGRTSGRIQNEAASGMHVHVGVEDLDRRVQVAGRAAPYLPLLVAVTAASPVINGYNTLEQNARITNFSALPSRVELPPLNSWSEFQNEMAEVMRMLQVDDPTKVHSFIRVVQKFPTVEFRMFDNPLTVDDWVFNAYLAAGLVSDIVDEVDNARSPEASVPSYALMVMKKAALHGLNGELFDPVLQAYRPSIDVVTETLFSRVQRGLARIEQIQDIEPGLVVGEFKALANAVLEGGTGATRVLKLVEVIGADSSQTDMARWRTGQDRLDHQSLQALVANLIWMNNFGSLLPIDHARDERLLNDLDLGNKSPSGTSAHTAAEARLLLEKVHQIVPQ